ncbi:hypothetical protein V6N13_021383 [Hibiscus sabdariffa]
MRKVEALNAEKTALTQQSRNGKQHIGYGMVRDFISEFKEAKEKEREKEAEERRKQREKEYESRRSDSGDREKYQDRDKDRGRYWERDLDHGRSREQNGRGSRDRARDWRYRNCKDGGRDRHQKRSRLFFSAISISICRQTNTTKVILKASALKVS